VETVQSVQADLVRKLQAVVWLVRKAGPYLALEILMPGGTLLALLLFVYRRRVEARDPRALALRSLATRVVDEVRLRVAPMRARVEMHTTV
jgi:hypothetical protein